MAHVVGGNVQPEENDQQSLFDTQVCKVGENVTLLAPIA